MVFGRALVGGMTAVLLSLSGAESSRAHGDGSGRERLSERSLRKVEARILGAHHAAEHARGRRLERRSRARWLRLSPARRRQVHEERRRRTRQQQTARVAMAGDPETDGRWNGQIPVPVAGVHAALLPTGKVMWFSRPDADGPENEAIAYLWDPTMPMGDAAALRRVEPPDNPDTGRPVNLWCAGQSLLADGRLLVTGGNLAYKNATSDWKGLDRTYTFDPWTEEWTEQPRMARGRWYPTQTLLPDGRTMIVAGRDETGDPSDAMNSDIELFSPPATHDGQGSVTKVGEYGASLPGSPYRPDYYPHWFVMPNGNLLNAGPTRDESWSLTLTGNALSSADRPPWARNRFYATGVLLPAGPAGSTRVAKIGGFGSYGAGGGEASPSTEVFDEAAPAGAPVPGPTLAQARAHHNTVLLPDGSMVSVGGGYGYRNNDLRLSGPEHLPIEIWNPADNTWRLGPAQVFKRAYHSTAVLLPDGRVVSAGDDRDPAKDPGRRTDIAEVYEPAYLFAPGPRPEITAAPAGVSWNQPFAVTTATPIARAVLMAPGATTHANDMQQRHVELRIQPTATGADLIAPPNANVAPPGWYMLFALSPSGKPSIAKWIRLGESTPLPQSPVPTATPTATPTPRATPSPSPSPLPSPSASPPPTPSPEDTIAPRLSMQSLSQKLGRAVRNGLPLAITTNEGGRAAITLFVNRATARKLGLERPVRGPVRVGRVERTLPSGRSPVRVELTGEARRAIKQARKLTLRISVVIADAAGNRARHAKTVELKRH